jgi:hypothetical protein
MTPASARAAADVLMSHREAGTRLGESSNCEFGELSVRFA